MTDYTLSSVKSQISDPSEKAPQGFIDAANQARAEEIELHARDQFLKLRGIWSAWLIAWISFLLAFHIGLAIAVGRSILNYEKYVWFLPMVVVENFAQVVAMGLVIVRFLYPGERIAGRAVISSSRGAKQAR